MSIPWSTALVTYESLGVQSDEGAGARLSMSSMSISLRPEDEPEQEETQSLNNPKTEASMSPLTESRVQTERGLGCRRREG